MLTTSSACGAAASVVRRDRADYRLIFASAFVVYLPVTMIARLLFLRRDRQPMEEPHSRPSILREARESAAYTASLALMR